MKPLVIAQKGPSSHALASVQQISPRGKRYRQTNRITTLRAAKTRTVSFSSIFPENAAAKQPTITSGLQLKPHANVDSCLTPVSTEALLHSPAITEFWPDACRSLRLLHRRDIFDDHQTYMYLCIPRPHDTCPHPYASDWIGTNSWPRFENKKTQSWVASSLVEEE